MMIISWLVLVGILSALALPAALLTKSWRRFFLALILSFAGVVLPLFVFLFSVFMAPDCKGDCHHGWLDCFHACKLTLTPLVLWATAALYALEVLRVQNKTSPWIVLGLLTGALVSGGCLGIGLWISDETSGWMNLWLLVPFYVFVWHALRAAQLLRAANTSFTTILATIVSSVPFWIASFWWATKTYLDLPNESPSCFVVTAAGRGHERIVGPFVEVNRHGVTRRVNQQLLTFWQFENAWSTRASRSHAAFRLAYNRIGPVIAGKINSPLVADVAYVALKPVELAARISLSLASK